MVFAPTHLAPSFDPLELYAAAIDTSDYARRVGPLVRNLVPEIGALLDVGAGGGQLGRVLRSPNATWSAIEPSLVMRRRLERLRAPPRIFDCDWRAAKIAKRSHDTVLAATMPAFFHDPVAFLTRCRTWARRVVIWVVPAQHGPRGLIYAGCLPRHWHGEDETPGIDLVLRALPAGQRPDEMATVDWTFSGVLADLGDLAAYLAGRLGWSIDDGRREQLADRLQASAEAAGGRWRLNIPRRSAVLVWWVR